MIIIVFVILSEFTGWYGSGLLHEVGTIKILVIPGQTSARARDVTLLSWRAIADQTCVVDLIFLNFLCGGLTIFDLFHNGGLSACLTFSWIPLGASSSACLSSASRSFKSVPSDLLKLAGSLSSSSSLSCSSREESEKFLFTNEVSAALDTRFNGLCVSAKTGLKIWKNEVFSPDQVLNHFSHDLSYLSIPFRATSTFVAVFRSIYPILLVCF